MTELMLDTFGATEAAYLHGIREEGELACVSFSLDTSTEPRGLAMAWFFFRLFRVLGWRLTADFARAFSKRPKYQDAYLELMLLGTLPAHQGRGLGRKMLRFVYGFAEENGYKGVILGVAKETPAYGFYCREGFVVDSEVHCGALPLCNMRRDKEGTADSSRSG